MQQIEVKIDKRELGDGLSFYEITIPIIKIGDFRYIKSNMDTIYLANKDIVIKSYRVQDMENNQIEMIKADVLNMYPEEVRKYVVFVALNGFCRIS